MNQSWLIGPGEDPQYDLSKDVRERTPDGAPDCGWVGQMRLLLTLYSNPADRILDPFAGYGTTLVACALENRRGIGVEIMPERCETARSRLADAKLAGFPEQRVLCGDSRNLPLESDSIDLVLSSIPYFGAAATLPENSGQAYRVSCYREYLEILHAVIYDAKRVLRPGGTAVFAAENVTLANGAVVPLAWDAGKILGELLTLKEERVLCYHRDRPPFAANAAYTNRAHEYVLVAKKEKPELDLREAIPLLEDMARAGLRAILVGSLGIHLRSAGRQLVPVHDIDLFVPNDEKNADALLRFLEHCGFSFSIWDEPLAKPMTFIDLENKYFLRAKRLSPNGALLVVDLMFAHPEVTYRELESDADSIGLLTVASAPALARLAARVA